MSKNKYIAKSIVRNSDGSINTELTSQKYEALVLAAYDETLVAAEAAAKTTYDSLVESFGNDLQEYVITRAAWDERIAKHITAAFDKLPASIKGGCIAKSTLVNMSAAAMLTAGEINIVDMKKASDMVASYIDDNKGVIFEVLAGAHGGVRLIKSNDSAIRA